MAHADSELDHASRRNDERNTELGYAFAFLVIVHSLAFRILLPLDGGRQNGLFSWIALSGIGTLAVWLMSATRTLWQRLMRGVIALSVAAWIVKDVIVYLQLPRATISNVGPATGFLSDRRILPVFVPSNTVAAHILVGWLAGAFFIAFILHWFLGLRLIPPGLPSHRKPMSMWKIFVLVFFAALASYFLRGSAWLSRVSFLSNGATSGAIAWTAAYTFSHRVRWKAIASYFAVILGIIALDMTLGWLMGAWSGDPFARMRYTTIFTVGLSTSPLATFALLRAYGYRVET